jgi:signal transduction histidine kinase
MRLLWTLLRVALFVIVRDILVGKQANANAEEAAKREAQRRMNEFLSIASHELKTPLTSIKGNIQLMGRKLKSNATIASATSSNSTSGKQTEQASYLLNETRELLERTDKQITQLTRLVNTLLEGSRINANTIDLLFEMSELDTLLQEVVQDLRSIPKERVVHVDIPEGESVLIMADVTRVKQVVVHLVSNAHKYSPLKEHIKIALRVEGNTAHVTVSDAGPGIPTNEQNKIWERYYRVPDITVQNGSEIGLGLGLHISRTIIEQHHGKIGVQSTPGAGSTFWFTLPLYNKETA